MMNDYSKIQKVQDSLGQLSEHREEEEEEIMQTDGEIVPKPEEDIIEDLHEDIPEDVPEEMPENDVVQSEVYIVKKGDTLASISLQTYGDMSRVKDICEINGLQDGNLIIIGQKLLLP